MNQFSPHINPYDVLEISPTASNQEITIAFTMAMKRRKYSAKEIAQARKSLMNPQTRIIADYLRPIISLVKEFEKSDLSTLDSPLENLDIIAEFNNLKQDIFALDSISDADRELGTSLFFSSEDFQQN